MLDQSRADKGQTKIKMAILVWSVSGVCPLARVGLDTFLLSGLKKPNFLNLCPQAELSHWTLQQRKKVVDTLLSHVPGLVP